MEIAFAVVLVLLLWWAGTGVVLWLDSRPPRTYRRSIAIATGALLAALYGVHASAADASPAAACVAFTMALLVWGWLELSFLTGWITGPRRRGCTPACAGWRHFVHAVQAILYHELAIVAAAAALIALTWGGPNKTALWGFLILWAMRQSAKLNLFFGVRNRSIELLPAQLRYLGTYFGRRNFNVFFPVSLLGSGAALALLADAVLAPGQSRFDMLSGVLLVSLLALGILEHLLLVLPLPINRMWRWWMGVRSARASSAVGTSLDHLEPR